MIGRAGRAAGDGTGASRPRRRPAAAAPAGYFETKIAVACRPRRARIMEGRA